MNSEAPPGPLELTFGDYRLFHQLLGEHDEHAKVLERELGVRIGLAGTALTVSGDPIAVELAGRVLTQLYRLLEKGYPVFASDVDYAIEEFILSVATAFEWSGNNLKSHGRLSSKFTRFLRTSWDALPREVRATSRSQLISHARRVLRERGKFPQSDTN